MLHRVTLCCVDNCVDKRRENYYLYLYCYRYYIVLFIANVQGQRCIRLCNAIMQISFPVIIYLSLKGNTEKERILKS